MQLGTPLSLKAKLFRGLSDPSRLQILETLLAGERTVSQIVEETGLSQPNVSSHLACLKDCGLVRSQQNGRHRYYSLADAEVAALLEKAELLLAKVSEEIYRCTRY